MSRPVLLLALAMGAAAPVPAAAAEVIQTLGRRVTITGNLLALTEPDLDRIALYDVSGARPRKIGAFGRTGFRPGELHGPHGASLDARGRVYVADTFSHTIRRITVAGEVSTLAGLAGSSGSVDGTGSAARFFQPN